MWRLQCEQFEVEFSAETDLIIGSGDGCGLLIRDPIVSRKHARLSIRNGLVLVEDLGSKNGTIVDGKRLEPGSSEPVNERSSILLAQSIPCYLLPLEYIEQAESLTSTCLLAYSLAQKKLNDAEDDSLQSRLEQVCRENSAIAPYQSLLLQEFCSFSQIERLLGESDISEILINGPHEIWIEVRGELSLSQEKFHTDIGLELYVNQCLDGIGKKIDRLHPFASGRLQDGSRITVIADSVVHEGIHVSIRKFHGQLQSLIALKAVDFFPPMAMTILKRIVAEKQNLIVSGGTGSGKTTLLGALLSEIDVRERIFLIEDTSEIQSQRKNLVRCEARERNIDGVGEISIRDLLRQSLRMRPDRIILGECRGDETIDLLQALNSGHSGSMSTLHANSTREAIHRLELLCLLSKEKLDPMVARKFIASSVQVIIQLGRVRGKRTIAMISRVAGFDNDQVLLETLYSRHDDSKSNCPAK